MELPFVFLRYIFFSDSLKVFGFLVTLLNIIGKKVIFSKISYFQLQYLFCCCLVYKQHIYCANLVQKFKIVSLSWNLAPRITQICIIQWWCFLFCFRLEIPFLGKFGSFPQKIVSLNWNLVPSLIRICKIQWSFSLLLFLTGNIFFCKFGSKTQNYQFRPKFGT